MVEKVISSRPQMGDFQVAIRGEFCDWQSKCRPNGNGWLKPQQMNNEAQEEGGIFVNERILFQRKQANQ
jgi:hypothetical protein